jgi:hypothetical protein
MVSGDVLILKSKVNFKSLNEISYGKRKRQMRRSQRLGTKFKFFC